jgi:NADPH-dependent curcumin reductase CurA
MEGFIVMDYFGRSHEAIVQMSDWIEAGKLRYATDIVDGLDSAPAAFERLFTGANAGKVMVRL